MRVVVTGAAGFIGSHLTEAMLHDGHDVVGIDCFTDYYGREAKETNLAVAHCHPRFRLVDADLRTDDLAPLVAGADVVVNEAATPGLVLSWDDFDRYQSCNLAAVKRLADACLAEGVGHLVQASTSSVYGAEATAAEDEPTRPVSPYGVTKLAAEHLLRAYHETDGLPLTVLRYFSIYGPRQRPDMAYRIFCERLLRDEPIRVYGDGSQTRTNTFVSDCVAATVAALERPPDGSTFNIGGGRELALCDAIAILSDVSGVEARIEWHPVRRGDQRRTVADTRRAAVELGWKPVVEPEDGLEQQLRWVADQISDR